MKDGKDRSVTYPTSNEFRNKKFLNIATALGIGVSAAVLSFEADAEEKKIDDAKKGGMELGDIFGARPPAKKEKVAEDKEKVAKEKKDNESEAKKNRETIILLAANLGHDNFKEIITPFFIYLR